MYPNLRFAVYDILGLDIPALSLLQSFGFFLALAFISAAWWLGVELRRRENEGLLQGIQETTVVGKPLTASDIITNALIGFILGFKGVYALSHSDVFAGDQARDALFSWQHGNWLAGILGVAFFVGWKIYEKRQERAQYPNETTISKMVMPHERIGDIIMLAAISGVFGAKVLYLLEEQPKDWVSELFSGSGLTVYGGLIFAFFVVSWYIRKKQIPYTHVLDTAGPAMILAYGVGRLGCHFSGDGDWGDPNLSPKPFAWLPDWLWAYSYPNNVINSNGHPHIVLPDCGGYPFGADFGNCTQLVPSVYPTPVWEFLMAFVLFLILVGLRRWAKQGGLLFFIYLIFNGLERFTIEMIRVNADYEIFGVALTQAQIIASVLFVIGVVGTIFLYNKQRQNYPS